MYTEHSTVRTYPGGNHIYINTTWGRIIWTVVGRYFRVGKVQVDNWVVFSRFFGSVCIFVPVRPVGCRWLDGVAHYFTCSPLARPPRAVFSFSDEGLGSGAG